MHLELHVAVATRIVEHVAKAKWIHIISRSYKSLQHYKAKGKVESKR